jgi:hypothetical protein
MAETTTSAELVPDPEPEPSSVAPAAAASTIPAATDLVQESPPSEDPPSDDPEGDAWTPSHGVDPEIAERELQATRRMVAAHAPLRVPSVADPDSVENQRVLQTMVLKALSKSPKPTAAIPEGDAEAPSQASPASP